MSYRLRTLQNLLAVEVAAIGQNGREPNQLHVTLRLALQAPARLNAAQIAVDVDLEQRRRMVRGPAGVSRSRAVNPQRRQIERLYEGINGADRIILGDPYLNSLKSMALAIA